MPSLTIGSLRRARQCHWQSHAGDRCSSVDLWEDVREETRLRKEAQRHEERTAGEPRTQRLGHRHGKEARVFGIAAGDPPRDARPVFGLGSKGLEVAVSLCSKNCRFYFQMVALEYWSIRNSTNGMRPKSRMKLDVLSHPAVVDRNSFPSEGSIEEQPLSYVEVFKLKVCRAGNEEGGMFSRTIIRNIGGFDISDGND